MKYLLAAVLLVVSQTAFAKAIAKSTDTPSELITMVHQAPVAVIPAIPDPLKMIGDSVNKVVMITVTGHITDEDSGVKENIGWTGSGAFISADGIILSCDHLFIRRIEDRNILVKTASGKVYTALLLGQDSKSDLSLLKIFSLTSVPYFTIASTTPVRGQTVWAFGAPLGINKTVSTGFIQNLDVDDGEKDKPTRTLHSAGLNPGNSGGPLVNELGQLVGVNVSVRVVNFFMRAEGMGQSVTLRDINSFLKD